MHKFPTCLIYPIFFLFCCCKKDNSGPSEFLNFKFNEAEIKCENFSYFSSTSAGGNIPDLTISGNKGQARITIRLFPDSGFVVPGIYEFKPGNGSGCIYVTPTIMILGFPVSLEYYGGSSFDRTQFYGPGQITITQIDDKFIKGKFWFTGMFPGNSSSQGEFSNGEFSLVRR